MESLYLLIPIALVFCAIAIRLLLWAIDNGQYDDLDRESWRILTDEDDLQAAGRPGDQHNDSPGSAPQAAPGTTSDTLPDSSGDMKARPASNSNSNST